MTDKKPLTVKIIIGILTLQLAWTFLIIVLFYFAKDINPVEGTATKGFLDAITSRFGLDLSDPLKAFGLLIGLQIIPSLLNFFTLIFIADRNFWLTIITISLSLLVAMPQGLPIATIIIFILTLNSATRNYLKKENNKAQASSE